LAPLFEAALADKPLEHQLLQMKVGGLRALSEVGGWRGLYAATARHLWPKFQPDSADFPDWIV